MSWLKWKRINTIECKKKTEINFIKDYSFFIPRCYIDFGKDRVFRISNKDYNKVWMKKGENYETKETRN